MRFSKSDFPRQTRVIDGAFRCCAGAAVKAGDQDGSGACLCNTGGNRSDACLGDELYGDCCVAVGIFQIIDELRKVFNGIDVVMRRRRDQTDTRGGTTRFRNPRVDLCARKVPALAGLCLN